MKQPVVRECVSSIRERSERFTDGAAGVPVSDWTERTGARKSSLFRRRRSRSVFGPAFCKEWSRAARPDAVKKWALLRELCSLLSSELDRTTRTFALANMV
jgi:hypothetical protein